ncbi:MAG: type II toxin-antitoxin system VapC family toxin [Rhodomicrobium sp.]
MKLLLDTHVLVWWFAGDLRLPVATRQLIDGPEAEPYVSAATAWELTTKYRLGKLKEAAPLVESFFDLLDRYGFKRLSINTEHAHRAGLLSGDHKDPFDRMLAAQALIEDMGLVTADPLLAALGAKVIW